MELKWNKTLFGFEEAELYGYTITEDINGEYHPAGITVDFYGDIVSCDSEDDAIEKIEREVIRRLKQELDKLNKEYEDTFNFNTQLDNHQFFIIDDYEEFYYDCSVFDDVFNKVEKIVQDVFFNKEATIECEIRGRWVVVL